LRGIMRNTEGGKMALTKDKSLKSPCRKSLGLLVVLAVLLVACPLAVLAAEPAVSIPDASAEQGEEVTLPISISGVTSLGAVDIRLHYDSSVVEVSSVAEGDLGAITYGIDNPGGVTRMNWFSATGETGDFTFARVTLRAVGTDGAASPLELDVRTIVNTDAQPILHGLDEGTFTAGLGGQYTLTISSAAGGSVTTPGEGTFSYGDAEVVNLVAQADAGYRFDGWTGDVAAVADVNRARTTITMDADKSISAAFTEAGAPGGLSTKWLIIIIAAVVVVVVVVLVVRRRRRYM
jgi:hypothetical protein